MNKISPLNPAAQSALPLALATLALFAGACGSPNTLDVVDRDQTILGTAMSFAVLGASTVTNTGATTVYGDLGVTPGLEITGFPPGLVAGGTIHSGDAVALQAQSDASTAYDGLAGQAFIEDLSNQDLGGMVLTPGVYRFSSSAQLTGELTLDAQGDSAAVFVFQIGSTLTTATDSSVAVINGTNDCNIFWQVGSSATLGTTTVFRGNILARTSITMDTGAIVSGRALALDAAVTMDTNNVSILACDAIEDDTTESSGTSESSDSGEASDDGGTSDGGETGLGETGVGETGVGETGVGETGVGETGETGETGGTSEGGSTTDAGGTTGAGDDAGTSGGGGSTDEGGTSSSDDHGSDDHHGTSTECPYQDTNPTD